MGLRKKRKQKFQKRKWVACLPSLGVEKLVRYGQSILLFVFLLEMMNITGVIFIAEAGRRFVWFFVYHQAKWLGMDKWKLDFYVHW